MTIQEAIKIAKKGGLDLYDVPPIDLENLCIEETAPLFLSRAFWQCLGKALGWEKGTTYTFTSKAKEVTAVKRGGGGLRVYMVPEHTVTRTSKPTPLRWKREWHNFIDYLAKGSTPESYFENLK